MTAKGGTETYKVVTANRLVDGAIVYLRRDDTSVVWVEKIENASVFPESEIEQMITVAEEDVDRNIVVAPYAIEITGKHEPRSARETIRARGPSVKYGRAALEPDFNI